MVKLLSTFSQFDSIHVLVIGDLMLDTYTTGKVERISPEAPVPILRVSSHTALPGGAGNVVLNLLSLGATVSCAGRVGGDFAGESLCNLLNVEGANVDAIFEEEGFATPIKNRLLADNQQLMRIDHEAVVELNPHTEEKLKNKILTMLESVDIIAVSDYGKGLLTRSLLAFMIAECQKRDIPILVDPKGTDFTKYRGATLIKPNLKEALAAVQENLPNLSEVGQRLLEITQSAFLMITLSEKGIALFEQEGRRLDFPVRSKEVIDVTGAGDTVLAIMTLALGNGLSIECACDLANIAAGIAIEKVGCVRVTLAEMSERLLALDSSNKIYTEDHLYALKYILKKFPFVVLALEELEGASIDIFKAVKSLACEGKKMLLYCAEHTDEDVLTFLTSIKEVDYVIMKSESLRHLCEEITPQELYTLRQKTLVKMEHASHLLSSLMPAKEKTHGSYNLS